MTHHPKAKNNYLFLTGFLFCLFNFFLFNILIKCKKKIINIYYFFILKVILLFLSLHYLFPEIFNLQEKFFFFILLFS